MVERIQCGGSGRESGTLGGFRSNGRIMSMMECSLFEVSIEYRLRSMIIRTRVA